MALLGFMGGETGDLAEVSSIRGTVAIDSSAGNFHVGGAYSYKVGNNGGNNSSISTPNSLNQSTIFIRCYTKASWTSTTTNDRTDVIGCWQASLAGFIAGARLVWNGTQVVIRLLNGGTQVGSDIPVTLSDTFHLLEMKVVVSATVGEVHLRLDGTEILGQTGLNTGTTNVGQVLFGSDNNTSTTVTGFVWVDDCAWASTVTGPSIGPGVSLARQFNTTAPNYNTWTKSTGSIWNVWDDTPFSATTNATQATSTNKQTGVVSFGNITDTGATGHGTASIVSSDVINAAKIGWVGKTSSVTTDGADSSIFRTPAGAGGADTTTAGVVYTTADTYQQTYFTNPTTAQILNCEAGISKGTGTQTHTVEDVWLIVDVTLQRSPPLPARFQHRRIPHVRAKRPVHFTIPYRGPLAPHPDFPEQLRRQSQKRRIPVIRPKPRVRNRWIDERQVTAPHADFPEQIRRQSQKKRIPTVKAKRVTRSNIELRNVQAPPSIFPSELRHQVQKKRVPQAKAKRVVRNSLELRNPGPLRLQNPVAAHRGQKHRLPVVKAKRAVRSSLELRIPQAPSPILPLSVRHQRGQPRRLPNVKAKRVVRSSIELRIPQAPSATPPLPIEARRAQRKRVTPTIRRQRRIFALFRVAPASVPSLIFGRHHRVRIPVIRPKRGVRGNIQLLIAPPLAAALPLPVRHARGQSRRLAKVQAKRVTRSSIELRIPPVLAPILPLPARHQRGQPRRVPRVRAKPAVRSSIELRIPQAPAATLPLSVRHARGQTKRLANSKAKRPVRNSIELRIPPALSPILPLSVRHQRGQSRRLPNVRAKRVTRSSIELRIPSSPPVIFPPALRHGRDQPKRIPRVKAKPAVRNSVELRIPPAVTQILPLPVRHARGQSRRLAKVKAKRATRSSIELRIPQAPHPDFPQGIRRRVQRKPLFKVKAKQRVRSNIELRIPPAPLAFAPISIRGRSKHKLWHYIRAKRVAVSKFMQLSKVPAPFIPPPPPSPDILARWRNRGGPGASRIHGQG